MTQPYRRTNLTDPISYEEYIIHIITAYTMGMTIQYRRKVTKGHYWPLRDNNWDFLQLEYRVLEDTITASPNPTPPEIQLNEAAELQEVA